MLKNIIWKTKKIKKSMLFMLFLGMLGAAALGCGGKTGNTENKPVTITIWHVYGAQTDSPLNDLIQVFNDTVGKEEGIRVEVTMVSNNKNIHNHILSAANEDPGASDLPDIFVAYPNTVLAMPDENVLVDYKEYMSEEELSAFIPEFLEDGIIEDRLVVLPVAKSTELMFVNKTAFDRFSTATGAKMEDLNTWEGLYQTACEYTAWTDSLTPEIANDGKAMFVHDFHFNYFQVGTQSLGESFFEDKAIAFGPMYQKVWEPYAEAAVTGGLWLQGGYATEPLRTGEAIVAVASSASVLYFSNQVTYADNTTEEVELVTMPCPVFEGGKKLVMQRGAGMCTVKSTPEREAAAVVFLKWLTSPECNTKFAASTGYMPVTQEAFNKYLPKEIESLTDDKYIELYKAYQKTKEQYEFYTAPQFEGYLEMENTYEDVIRLQMQGARNEYLQSGGDNKEVRNSLIWNSYTSFRDEIK